MKKYLFNTLRYAVPLAIIAWLVVDIQRNDPESLAELRERPKNWGLLFAAFAAILVSASLTFYRWYWLVRALDIPFRLRDAFRLGFLGYLFNFVSLGVVGGDLFKAIFIAREQQSKRAEAVATVLVDRVVGLYGLLALTTLAMLTVRLPDYPELTALRFGTLTLTAIGTVALGSLLIPGLTALPALSGMTSIRRIGPIIHRLILAIELYQRRKGTVFLAVFVSLCCHALIALGIHLAAHGVFANAPTLPEHLVISPLAGVAGSLPLAPAGLGQYEFAMDFLYARVPEHGIGAGQGLVVAFCYRIITVLIAMIGGVFYMVNRSEVSDIVRQAESDRSRPLEPISDDTLGKVTTNGKRQTSAASE